MRALLTFTYCLYDVCTVWPFIESWNEMCKLWGWPSVCYYFIILNNNEAIRLSIVSLGCQIMAIRSYQHKLNPCDLCYIWVWYLETCCLLNFRACFSDRIKCWHPIPHLFFRHAYCLCFLVFFFYIDKWLILFKGSSRSINHLWRYLFIIIVRATFI